MAGALRYAARASRIAPSGPPHDTPGVIMFASGDAYPESLPDVSEFAQRAATRYRTETLQYAPRLGLSFTAPSRGSISPASFSSIPATRSS